MTAEAGEYGTQVLCDSKPSSAEESYDKLSSYAAGPPGLPTLEFLRWRYTKFTFYGTISGSRALTPLIP